MSDQLIAGDLDTPLEKLHRRARLMIHKKTGTTDQIHLAGRILAENDFTRASKLSQMWHNPSVYDGF